MWLHSGQWDVRKSIWEICNLCVFVYVYVCTQGTESRAPCIISMHSTTKLYLQLLQKICFYLFIYLFTYFWWNWGLNSGPSPWATPPTLFYDRYFQDSVSQTICPGWLWTTILLISASGVARITGVSHLAQEIFLKRKSSLRSSFFLLTRWSTGSRGRNHVPMLNLDCVVSSS
jgi:hypothetical protein